jgi:muconolactone D-isomerase
MLFHVIMDVRIPHDLDPALLETLKRTEKERSQALQRDGVWRHIWRVVGQYKNISIFDVQDSGELHDILSTLPGDAPLPSPLRDPRR